MPQKMKILIQFICVVQFDYEYLLNEDEETDFHDLSIVKIYERLKNHLGELKLVLDGKHNNRGTEFLINVFDRPLEHWIVRIFKGTNHESCEVLDFCGDMEMWFVLNQSNEATVCDSMLNIVSSLYDTEFPYSLLKSGSIYCLHCVEFICRLFIPEESNSTDIHVAFRASLSSMCQDDHTIDHILELWADIHRQIRFPQITSLENLSNCLSFLRICKSLLNDPTTISQINSYIIGVLQLVQIRAIVFALSNHIDQTIQESASIIHGPSTNANTDIVTASKFLCHHCIFVAPIPQVVVVDDDSEVEVFLKCFALYRKQAISKQRMKLIFQSIAISADRVVGRGWKTRFLAIAESSSSTSSTSSTRLTRPIPFIYDENHDNDLFRVIDTSIAELIVNRIPTFQFCRQVSKFLENRKNFRFNPLVDITSVLGLAVKEYKRSLSELVEHKGQEDDDNDSFFCLKHYLRQFYLNHGNKAQLDREIDAMVEVSPFALPGGVEIAGLSKYQRALCALTYKSLPEEHQLPLTAALAMVRDVNQVNVSKAYFQEKPQDERLNFEANWLLLLETIFSRHNSNYKLLKNLSTNRNVKSECAEFDGLLLLQTESGIHNLEAVVEVKSSISGGSLLEDMKKKLNGYYYLSSLKDEDNIAELKLTEDDNDDDNDSKTMQKRTVVIRVRLPNTLPPMIYLVGSLHIDSFTNDPNSTENVVLDRLGYVTATEVISTTWPRLPDTVVSSLFDPLVTKTDQGELVVPLTLDCNIKIQGYFDSRIAQHIPDNMIVFHVRNI